MTPRAVKKLMEEQRKAKKLLASLGALLEQGEFRGVSGDHAKEGIEMANLAAKTIRELAVETPGATRVFERLGIDYCCGGSKPLAEACSAANLEVDAVLRQLEESARAEHARNAGERDWSAAPMSELTARIVARHHGYVRQEIPRIQQLLAKVVSAHGQNHPELARIGRAFDALGQELTAHMFKEEQILFPYIDLMQAAIEKGQPLPPPFFGTVRNPVQMMMAEHDGAGEKLREMRRDSADYKVPEDACVTYATLYQALEQFEGDLHQHIHLENNILFPRALQAERRA